MSTRKSIHRKSSAYSIQSQVSGVLNPDSNIASDEENKDLEVPRSPVITSLPKKRTIFTKTIKRRTPNFDELLNDASEESLADQPSITAELESNRDERREETIAQPPRKSDSARNMSVQTDETDSEESIKKQRVPLRRNKRQSHQEEIFEQLLESPNISVRSEPAHTQQTRKSELPRHKTLLSDVERRSSKRKSNLVETPVSPSFEVEENQSARKLRRLSSSTNKSGFGRQSMNKTKDHADISGSLNAGLEENRSVSTQIRPSSIGKKSSAVRRSLIAASKTNRSYAADGIENIESSELLPPDTEGITQSATNRTQASFSSVDHNGTESVQPADESLGIGSQVSHAEKSSQLKSALEKIKGKEIVLKKTTTIDSYFKKISPTKPAKHVAAKDSQKPLSKTKPVVNENKIASVPPNEAYMVNGKVYKSPELPRPKSWATNRLYNYLWKKMEPKYHLRTRVRSAQFIVDLSRVVEIIVRRQKYDSYKEELNNLIHEMARLGIIETRKEFYTFCQTFLPYLFRIKVIPMLSRGNVFDIPFHPDKLHTPILKI